MKALFEKVIAVLESIENPTEETKKLLNQVKYMLSGELQKYFDSLKYSPRGLK